MSECGKVQPFVDAFVDGELSAERVLEVEQHLLECVSCLEHVQLTRALQTSTRQSVHGDCPLTTAFQQRVCTALKAERERHSDHKKLHSIAERKNRPLPWRTVVPVAAAAAMALAFASTKNNKGEARGVAPSPHQQAQLVPEPSEDQLIEELIRLHSSAPVPEVTEANHVTDLERQVGLPVRLAPELQNFGARWEGASVVPVRNQPAASLLYKLDGHRLTVYVFDPERVPLRRIRALEPRVVRDRPVFVGTRRGYSIAATEKRGVGYAVATDLSTLESAELVASLH
jgi:anti-sigma factor RsiW